MNTTMNNTFIDTILNKDVWTIIDDYKTTTEHFELHQKVTKKMREQVFRINKVILDNEEIRGNQIVNLDYGSYLLEWIQDEKDQEDREDENFEIGFIFDYGFGQCDGSLWNEFSGECYCEYCN